MNRELKNRALARLEHPNKSLSETESWVRLSEITSATQVASSYATFAHYEKLCLEALEHLLKVRIISEHRKDYEIVDLHQVTSAAQLQTIATKLA